MSQLGSILDVSVVRRVLQTVDRQTGRTEFEFPRGSRPTLLSNDLPIGG